MKVITHLEHLEDLIITSKKRFITAVKTLLLIVQGKKDDKSLLLEKIDGSLSIFFLKDPITNTFGIATKNVGIDFKKICHNRREILKNYNIEDVQKKLIAGFNLLKRLDLGGYAFQGDFLFIPEKLKEEKIKGEKYLIFTPNVITYAVKIKSQDELYQKISTAKFGLVIHTIYSVDVKDNKLVLNRVLAPDKIQNLIKQSSVIPELFLISNLHQKVELDNGEEIIKRVQEYMKELQMIKYKKPSDKSKYYFDRYINNKIKEEKLSNTPIDLRLYFIYYLIDKQEEERNKRKTEKGKNGVDKEFGKILKEARSDSFFNLLKVYILAKNIKKEFLTGFDKLPSKIGKTFFKEKGRFIPTAPEGFILETKDDLVKLIDRETFSRRNFLFGAFCKK